MKIIFEKDTIVLDEGNENKSSYNEDSLKKSTGQNILFNIIEKCIINEDEIEMIKEKEITPFMEKLYEILKEEFSLTEDEI